MKQLPRELIAHVECGSENTLEEVGGKHAKLWVTDDTDLEDREIVYKYEYRIQLQYRDRYGKWQDVTDEDLLQFGNFFEKMKTREILRRLY